MATSSGSADLPLHGGRVPAWLRQRMETLGRLVVETVVHHYGREEFMRRLSEPFWFQSFGAVMGMDWHSSGITTSVMGALKRGLEPVAADLGLFVCGGRGRHSRKTPAELVGLGERYGLPGDELAGTSKLVAKVDSAAVQDGFDLYLHNFVVAADASWVVVQQGMSPRQKLARRYHWHSESVAPSRGGEGLVEEPHTAIEGIPVGEIVNLTDRRASPSRSAQIELLVSGPDRVVETLARLEGRPLTQTLPHLNLTAHHEVLASDVDLRRLHGTLAAVAESGAKDYVDLLRHKGVGARTLLAVAMVAEVVHGAPCRFEDPGRFSLALGGKDGHPFPVPLDVYDDTIGVLRGALNSARLGNEERLTAMKRLDRQARVAEEWAEGPSYEEFVHREREASKRYGGRTVFDKPKPSPGRALGGPLSSPQSGRRGSQHSDSQSAKTRPRRGEQFDLF